MALMEPLYLIDGTAYIYRAYHALRNLSNSQGMPTNAVYGFTRMILKLIHERCARYVAVLFDAKGPTFRHEMYPEYKANRPPMPEDLALQIPYVKKVTAAFNLQAMEMPGFEADDLMGTLATLGVDAGFTVVLVTGDKDFVQLVSDRITIWDPMKDKRIDTASVRADFGIEPAQMIDVMGFSGDSSDNVPGVPGIGPKTALTLVKAYGDMKGVFASVDRIPQARQREKLIQFKEQAFLSRKLVTIRTDVPVGFEPESFLVKEPDQMRLSELFKFLEFRQLQQEYFKKKESGARNYHAILDSDALRLLAERLSAAKMISIDTETTGVDPLRADLVGISVAIVPHEAFYIPCGHVYPGCPELLPLDQVIAALKPPLENPDIGKIGQNIKYDAMVLARHGVGLTAMSFDTMIASYLLNPAKRAHNLDQIALDFLGHKTITFEEVAGKRGEVDGFRAVPIEKAVPYACEDADVVLLAKDVLEPELSKAGLKALFDTVEMPLVPVLMRMEERGILVDKARLLELSTSFAQQIEALERDIHALAGEAFNVHSPQQLSRILFEKFKLPYQKKTQKKTGYSTDVDVLTALAEHHELPALVLRHRTLAKLKSTYADALMELINPRTGRIHTSFNQSVAATGRLSSSDPNLQNIPIRTEEGRRIRSTFIPRAGWSLMSADYSQIELRILAHCSEDPILIRAFEQGEDIHYRTASEVFQVTGDAVSPELRRQAKVINFGIIYGMGAFSLARELGITQKMAKTYIEHYFSRYEGVKRFIDSTIATARQTQKTRTLLGRIRHLPEIGSPNATVRGFAERTAVNTPIQGTAADLIKVAMIAVDAAIREKGLESGMLLTVHDELVFEVSPDETGIIRDLVTEKMEKVWELKVPLKVNVAVGTNWAEAH